MLREQNENCKTDHPIFTYGVLHIYDTQLFYRNLKDNAALRLQNYLKSHD